MGRLQSVVFGVRNGGGKKAEGILSDESMKHWETELGVGSGDVHRNGR